MDVLWCILTRLETRLSLACWQGGGEASPQLCSQRRTDGQKWAYGKIIQERITLHGYKFHKITRGKDQFECRQ